MGKVYSLEGNVKQLGDMASELRSSRKPWIIGGDFNLDPPEMETALASWSQKRNYLLQACLRKH